MIKKLLFLAFTFITLVSIAFAQSDDVPTSQAERLFNNGKYKEAIPQLQKLLKKQPKNAKYNFYLGFCYFHSPTEQLKSIPYFEVAEKDKSTDFYYDLKYYLGQAYHLANKFDKAIAEFQSMKEAISPTRSGQELLNDINRRIEMCNIGKSLTQNPRKVNIINLGKQINSEYQDYAPIISADESVMIFTSRRKGSTGGLVDENGDYYEDIYISYNEGGQWQPPMKIDSLSTLKEIKGPRWSKAKKISRAINTDKHDAAIGLSPDGQKLFIYRNEDIYESTLIGTDWQLPVKLNPNINTKYKEPSASLSPDGKTLYFISDRKGGRGGKDIYISRKLNNGDWGPAENLGPKVNTPFDEDAPYIQADGKTLYFSSKGHSSMGGYDIFKTVLENGSWSSPQNLGYPVNTSGDDIYFVVSAKGDHAYFSSLRPGGVGNMDIYLLLFEGVNIPLTEVKGLVLGGDSLKPIGAQITVMDNQTGKEVGTFAANSKTGKYLLIFPPGKNYKITVTAEGYAPHTEDVFIPNQDTYYQLYQEIHFTPIKSNKGDAIGQKFNMQNAFFDITKRIESDSLTKKQFTSTVDSIEVLSEYLKYIKESINKKDFKSDTLAYEATNTIDLYIPVDSAAKILPKSELAIIDEVKYQNELAEKREKEGPGPKYDLATHSTRKHGKIMKHSIDSSGNIASAKDSIPRSRKMGLPSETDILLRTYFELSQYKLREEDKSKLDSISSYLIKNPQINISVNGHTDFTGGNHLNNVLSYQRANTVKNYLVKKGVNSKRIEVHGLGKWFPIASNSTEEGRNKNRRVEILKMK